jgi:hypothetical protein
VARIFGGQTDKRWRAKLAKKFAQEQKERGSILIDDENTPPVIPFYLVVVLLLFTFHITARTTFNYYY